MADNGRQGIPYTLNEARLVAARGRMDVYIRELMTFLVGRLDLVDDLTARSLTTARDDEYGTGWNHALAELRRRLGLGDPNG